MNRTLNSYLTNPHNSSPLTAFFKFLFFLYRLSMTPPNSPLNYLDSTTPFYLSLVHFAGDYLPPSITLYRQFYIGNLNEARMIAFTPPSHFYERTSRHTNYQLPSQPPIATTTTFPTEHTRLLNTLRPSHTIHFYLSPRQLHADDDENKWTLNISLGDTHFFIRCSYSRRVQPRRSCS